MCIDNIYPLVFLVAHCVHNSGFCASVMSMWRMYHYIDIHTYITTSVHGFLLTHIHPMPKLHNETVSRNVIRDLEPHNNSVTLQGNHFSHLVRDVIPYMIHSHLHLSITTTDFCTVGDCYSEVPLYHHIQHVHDTSIQTPQTPSSLYNSLGQSSIMSP